MEKPVNRIEEPVSQKSGSFGWYISLREGRVYGLTTTLGQKYDFLFLLLFDPEAFKMCKNTIKLLNFLVLPYLGFSKT